MQVVPYLYFNGNCEEAYNFYFEALGGDKTDIMRYGDQGPEVPPEVAQRVMHTELKLGDNLIYFSDTSSEGEHQVGSNVQINLNLDSEAEIHKVYEGLSQGATVTMELQDTFWGAIYGALTDKFGVSWSFNFMKEQPKE
jgi:PhnB protein